ncbi:MAG: AAA family ATPase [Candidatus Riflebacteria bacterium]|nr:AAA family ATPase [Candidatus Riflebacteria bacterium]
MTLQRYLSRDIGAAVARALSAFPIVVLTGMRQTGKTTLLQNDPALSGRRYLTLDDFPTLEAARRSPEQLLAGDDPVTLDEIQRVPQLLLAVKSLVDKGRRPGRFLLSGSGNLALVRGATESLAGRAAMLELCGFTRRELSGPLGPRPVLVELLAGRAPRDGQRRELA